MDLSRAVVCATAHRDRVVHGVDLLDDHRLRSDPHGHPRRQARHGRHAPEILSLRGDVCGKHPRPGPARPLVGDEVGQKRLACGVGRLVVPGPSVGLVRVRHEARRAVDEREGQAAQRRLAFSQINRLADGRREAVFGDGLHVGVEREERVAVEAGVDGGEAIGELAS